ncbi:hypothetical protein [Streptomyces sp. NPDC046979]|uniref:hypothetical protein n=1 Tax=Streptomyces sp. NPDC046979 TaxID=3154604 RepID=UPI00340DA403
MKCLVFVRLLHQQGMEQAALPEPLAFSSVLTFHDAIELFLITAAEHCGASVKDRGRFPDRFTEALHPSACPSGAEVQGLFGIRRLTDYRNGFKHTAGFPGTDAVSLARADATDFLDVNTPLLFGIEFAEIDLAMVMQQPDARARVHRAAEFFDAGDAVSAMGWLAYAFEELITAQMNDDDAPYGRSAFAFGPGLPRHSLRSDQVRRILDQPDMERRRGLPGRAAETLANEIAATREVARAMQEGLRLLALGVDFHQYRRFLRLTPAVSIGHQRAEPSFRAEDGYDPTQEEFAFCRQFVITVALRLAEVSRSAEAPSWHGARSGTARRAHVTDR